MVRKAWKRWALKTWSKKKKTIEKELNSQFIRTDPDEEDFEIFEAID